MKPTRGGNEAWRALSETHTRDGEPVEPMSAEAERVYKAAMLPQDVVITPTPIRKWLSEFLPLVAAGTLDLDELLAVVDEDLAIEPMACPWCRTGWYRRSSGPGWRQGTCLTCYLNKLRQAHEEKLREIEAKREVVAIKREVSSARDRLDPDRPRSHAPFRVCDVCGDRLPSAREWEKRTCAACLERAEHHQHPERVAMVRPQDDYDRGGYTVFTTDHAGMGARMLTCSCGFTRPETVTDTENRCPDCRERDDARQARKAV